MNILKNDFPCDYRGGGYTQRTLEILICILLIMKTFHLVKLEHDIAKLGNNGNGYALFTPALGIFINKISC